MTPLTRPKPVVLVGDGIENGLNAASLADVATMFGAECAFRGRISHAPPGENCFSTPGPPVPPEGVTAYNPLVALENSPESESLFGARFPQGSCLGLVVGNESRGVSKHVLAAACRIVHIPTASRTINTLNVAAAAAVGLYAVTTGGFRAANIRSDLDRRRPELLLMGGSDAFDIGSTIRSAAAFGWTRVYLHDRGNVWFDGSRDAKAVSRAAARRSRNSIRVVPSPASTSAGFTRVCVFTRGAGDIPLHRASLAGSSDTLLVMADEQTVDFSTQDWARFGSNVQYIGLSVPHQVQSPCLRLTSSIALAEACRQVGVCAAKRLQPVRRRRPVYDNALRLGDLPAGELVTHEELLGF